MKIFISENSMIPVKYRGIGLSLEDVNYAFDGGLYAEMLENRNFEAKEIRAKGGNISVSSGGGYGWEPYPAGADVALKLKTDRPLFAENPHYMRVVAGTDGVGMQNKAYDGIRLEKGTEYRVSFYVRSYDYKDAAFVGIYKEGVPIAIEKVKIKPNGKWTRYDVKLKSKVDVEGAQFAFTLRKAGMVHVNDFSMMPTNAIMGVFRRDAIELLKETKPKFLRFAGGRLPGCSLNPYAWKDSAWPTERRRHNWNPRATQGASAENGFRSPFAYYGQTLGIGFFECFRLAEYLSAQPVPAIALPAIPPTDPEFEACVQDALDLVEFANGGQDTMWGSLRAELGHSAPFNLKCLAVEEGATPEQLTAFAARFHLTSDVKLVLPTGAESETDFCAEQIHLTREELLAATDTFEGRSKTTHIELSPTVDPSENTPASGTWACALAEAAYLISLERHAGMVPFESFSPLFARIGYTQQAPALIWMDGSAAFGSASYYVQKLFSLYTGDVIILTEAEERGIYVCASEREGFTYVKLVNTTAEVVETEVEGDFDFGQLTRIIRMEGDLSAFNTREQPEEIAAKDVAPTSPRAATLPPHSFSILVFRR